MTSQLVWLSRTGAERMHVREHGKLNKRAKWPPDRVSRAEVAAEAGLIHLRIDKAGVAVAGGVDPGEYRT